MKLILSLLVIIFYTTGAVAESRWWNKGRGYDPFTGATPDGIVLDNQSASNLIDSCMPDSPAERFTLSFRSDNRHANPITRYKYKTDDNEVRSQRLPEWGFFITDSHGKRITVSVASTEESDGISSRAATKVTVRSDMSSSPIASKTLSGVNHPFAGENIWNLRFDKGHLLLSSGAHNQEVLAETDIPLNDMASFGFAASPAACVIISDIILTDNSQSSRQTSELWSDVSLLEDYLDATESGIEGYWTVFDRNLDESLLIPGGDYRLAIVKDLDRYAIIYLEGAKVNPSFWHPGMVKGYLMPTHFEGIYDAVWYDAEGLPMSRDIKAQSGEGETIIIRFPYQDSTLRLRKIRKK